jgi:hypothetical protein
MIDLLGFDAGERKNPQLCSRGFPGKRNIRRFKNQITDVTDFRDKWKTPSKQSIHPSNPWFVEFTKFG